MGADSTESDVLFALWVPAKKKHAWDVKVTGFLRPSCCGGFRLDLMWWCVLGNSVSSPKYIVYLSVVILRIIRIIQIRRGLWRSSSPTSYLKQSAMK